MSQGSKKHIYLLAAIVVLTVISACIKKKEYPLEPVITFKDFQTYGADSGYFYFRFTDGDGNVGLKNEDTSGTFNASSPYYYNLYMKYMYRKSDGTWSAFFNPNPLVNDTQYYKFRVPLVDVNTKNEPVSGEIRVKLHELRPSVSHKQIRYIFYIYDRSLNKSNVVETPEFTLP